MTLPGSLRGASSEAARHVERRLAESLADVGSRKRAEVASDLFGLAGLLRSQARLRRAVTDPSVPGEARGRLVRGLLEGKVDGASAAVLAEAVQHRWTSPRDLADTLEHFGVETAVRSAEDPGRVADELFAVQRLLAENSALRNAIGDPTRSHEDKQALLSGLLEGKVLASTATLVTQALSSSHRTVALAVEEFQRVAAAVQGERIATVRSARALSDGERDRLQRVLSRQYEREVHLNVVVDPDLVGGLRVEIGHDVIDGSVASRLDDARRRLAG